MSTLLSLSMFYIPILPGIMDHMSYMHVFMLSCSVLFAMPRTIACQAPLSMEFSRQEYWSGLPFPPLGDLPDPGIKALSLALVGGFFTTAPPGQSHTTYISF